MAMPVMLPSGRAKTEAGMGPRRQSAHRGDRQDLKPENEVEAMLAAQMTLTHALPMQAMARAHNTNIGPVLADTSRSTDRRGDPHAPEPAGARTLFAQSL
jgi:hypothetical protein